MITQPAAVHAVNVRPAWATRALDALREAAQTLSPQQGQPRPFDGRREIEARRLLALIRIAEDEIHANADLLSEALVPSGTAS
jgi:hypothetical protein